MRSRRFSKWRRTTAPISARACRLRFKRAALQRKQLRAIHWNQILKLAMACKRWECQ
jgi:hypothetical protein